MKINDALQGISSIFLDTPPVIYYVQGDQRYLNIVKEVFDRVDVGELIAVASPVTLAECLIIPYRTNQIKLQNEFTMQLMNSNNTVFNFIDQEIAQRAAEIRARYNIGLLDALQFGVALQAQCDVFFTNDTALKRVTEIKVIVVDDLEL